MRATSTAHLAMPAAASGLLMAIYLLLRPYGDVGDATSPQAAAAFADPLWIAAHVAGLLALAQLARVALRLADLRPGPLPQAARRSGLAGLVLVLPYYGAETFGLHALGRAAPGDPGVMRLVAEVREQPVALATFGLGLLLLGLCGLLIGLAWRGLARQVGAPGWAGWPFGALALAFAAQFALPPAGRMAYGIAYALAGLVLAGVALRAGRAGQSPTVFLPRETTSLSGGKTMPVSLPS